ncbi:unannotated protein [freshwater metagenome]|uniref:Unannotated protein n=1 Tax=freshwater metagenome TaxID=449393 RepID=A0A6J7BRT6_9ZZZZ|nr:response regulator [Actinomycetota bacterium]
MNRVLIAEDDLDISDPLVRALGREGYDVMHVTDGQQALDLAMAGGADILVLDLGLPGMDGLEVCRSLRSSGSAIPVLVLTARTGEPDLVVGLDAGADDYVGKPFRLAELLARIRVQLRRSVVQDNEMVTGGDVSIDLASHRVMAGGREAFLTPKEYDLLLVLMRRANAVVGRDELMREVWRTEWLGATKTLDMHISTLRRKLVDSSAKISTVRGIGFRFEKDH